MVISLLLLFSPPPHLLFSANDIAAIDVIGVPLLFSLHQHVPSASHFLFSQPEFFNLTLLFFSSREMFEGPYFKRSGAKDAFFIITMDLLFTCALQFTHRSVFFWSDLGSSVTPSRLCFTRRRRHPSRDLLGGRRLRQAVRTSAALRRCQTHGRRKKKSHSFPYRCPSLSCVACRVKTHSRETQRWRLKELIDAVGNEHARLSRASCLHTQIPSQEIFIGRTAADSM